MRSAFVLALGALAASASAQLSNLLPTSANGVAGSTANVFPWGTPATGYPGLRIMCVYDSSHFTAAPVPITTPILITNVRWRANDQAGSWTGGTYNPATLALATAAVDYTATSTAWASNAGPDYTVVHNGPVTVQAGTGNGVGVPGPMFVDIPVNPPFPYDPTAGDLVIDTDYVTGAWGGGSQPGLDVMTVNVLGARVYASTSYPNANGVDANLPVVEIGYIPATGSFATNTPLGQGCVRRFASFYENFPTPAAFDLTNTGVTMIPNAGSYIVTPGAGFLPVGSVQNPPQTLTLGDDAEVTVPFTTGSFVGPSGAWTGLSVISNGIVSQAAGNSLVASPSIGTVLNNPQTGFYTQGDWDPSVGGTITVEQSGPVTTVTWTNVPSWSITGSQNTFQMQFYSSGLVALAWGAMAPTGGNGGILVGYSPGGPNADPGNTDLSALAGALVLDTSDTVPLTLVGATRPITGSSWNLNVGNVPATGTIGIDIFGLSDPGVVDLGFLGAPGCGARASLDLLSAWIVAGSTHTYSLAVPNNPALVNFHVFTQSAVLQPGVNALLGGVITSNGIDGKIGDS
jgi:hypothetical protein